MHCQQRSSKYITVLMINMQNSFLKTFNCKLSIFFLLLFDLKFYKKCFKTVQFVQGSFNAAFFFLAANAAFFLAVNFKIRSQILLKVGWTNNWHIQAQLYNRILECS